MFLIAPSPLLNMGSTGRNLNLITVIRNTRGAFFFLIVELRELRRRSQAVQRNLPRPSDVNSTVLRPPNVDPPLTGIQRVRLCFVSDFVVVSSVDGIVGT